MFDFSPVQILIVLAIALLVFGPKRLPELARSVGRGVREFKSGISLDDDAPSPEPPRSSRAVIAPAAPDAPGAAQAAPAGSGDAPAEPDADGEEVVVDDLLVPGDDQPSGSRPV